MPVFVILCLEECITQSDSLDTLHTRILCELRIDVEEDRHVHCLSSIQPLFLEAETLDLAKVWSDLSWCDRIGGHANNVFRRFVGCGVESKGSFTWEYSDFALLGDKFPG
jgi:hypothetical protein